MTVMTCTPAHLSVAPFGLARWLARLGAVIARVPIRGVLTAVWFLLAASAIVAADEHQQDWIPEALVIPNDAEVVTDRAIGSTVRMYSIATNVDVDTLLAEWEESLSTAGYPVTQGADDLLERSIEFSGPGIANAKIIVAPATEDGRSVIEFDATLD